MSKFDSPETWRWLARSFAIACVLAMVLSAYYIVVKSSDVVNSSPRNQSTAQVVDRVAQAGATQTGVYLLLFSVPLGIASTACGVLSLKD